METKEQFRQIINKIYRAGGSTYFVGGYVRDKVLGLSGGDIDIEVFGLAKENLEAVIGETLIEQGVSFPVYKVAGLLEVDLAIPRREISTGKSHTDFDTVADPFMSLEEAASRRDFTMNAIMMNAHSGEIFDPFNGLEDLSNLSLNPTSERFKEDPLRVLRGMQFASRFNLTPTSLAVDYAKEIFSGYTELSKERVWAEWLKWAKGQYPSKGLEYLEASGWLGHFEEISMLPQVLQAPRHHPEGNVWNHTLQVVDQVRSMSDDPRLVFAGLLHDIGKTSRTVGKGDDITSYGHEDAGAEKVHGFFRSLAGNDGLAKSYANFVMPLVREHMAHVHMPNPKPKSVRQLALRLSPANIRELTILSNADLAGRYPKAPAFKMAKILSVAARIEVQDSAPKPIVQGRHLIDWGLKPGVHFGKILETFFEEQIAGTFSNLEEAKLWASEKGMVAQK